MAELDRLEVRIEADLSQFRSELQKSERVAQASTANLGRRFGELDRAVAPVGASIASLGLATTSFGDAARSANPDQAFEGLATTARGLGSAFSSAFEDAVIGGRDLSGVLRGLESDILRVLTRQIITRPLTDIFAGLLGSGSSGGGGLLAPLFHGGGVVGSTPVSRRVVPGAVFDSAPRFARGGIVGVQPGLAPGEVPAILHRGETVRTPAQEAALRSQGGGEVIFASGAIVIQTPSPGAFAESRGQIEAMLADAVRRGRRNR